jgi:hypothetical protein
MHIMMSRSKSSSRKRSDSVYKILLFVVEDQVKQAVMTLQPPIHVLR